jgi:predicted PurR-regulated permease PerM
MLTSRRLGRVPAGGERRSHAMGWRTMDMLRAVSVGIGVYFAFRAIWAASTVLLVVFLGILFGLALSAGVDRLAGAHLGRWRVPRAVSAAVIVLGLFGSLGIIGAAMYPTLAEQAQEIQRRLPEAVRKMSTWTMAEEGGVVRAITGHRAPDRALPPRPVALSGPDRVALPGETPDIAARVSEQAAALSRFLFGFVGSTVEVIVYALLILFVGVYVAADPALYHRGLLHLFPHRARERAGDVFSAIAIVLRKWLVTQAIAMLTIAIAWAVALSLLGVKAALALAVIAGFLEFVPTIGPTLAVVPAVAMALLDSPQKAASVLVVYLIIQGVESNVLIPMLMKGQIHLAPALTIVAQALMTLAFGFLGLMVAVPLTAALIVPVKLLYVEDVVGDAMSDAEADPASPGLVGQLAT